MNKMKLFRFLLSMGAFLPFAGSAQTLLEQENETLYQFFVWLKSGEKTGYLTSEKPEFKLNGDVVTFWTKSMSVDIPKDELDKFTMEQVLPEHPTGITLPATLTVGLNQTAQLGYTLIPADASTQVTWLNSAPTVVSVTANGLVTGLQPGEATVRAQTGNGLRAACQVTVTVPTYRLVVWTYDQKRAYYDFADKPEITISGDIFTVTSAKATVGYKATDIWKFTLEDADLPIEEDFLFADANGDGTVDVADIATIIMVMAAGDKVVEQVIAADVNGDGTVDVADIATVISVMAGK